MRRIRDRRPNSLFRHAELPRLLTMIVMLGVLALLVGRASDPGTWRWLASDSRDDSQTATSSTSGEQEIAAAEPHAGGPTDQDPQELDAAREEFQAVTDKTPLGKEEMPAYWRLMAWQEHQSLDELRARAARGVTFQQLWQQPEKWRGKLIELKLHLRQTAEVKELADNDLGLKEMVEVWGWNTDSQPYWYWLVCPRLPPGMPSGKNIYAEATFVGYFLKLLPYEDHQGKTLTTPLLIGRLVWHPTPDGATANSQEWTWSWIAVVGGAMAIFVARMGLRLFGRTGRGNSAALFPAADPTQAVDAWLAGAESAERNDHEPHQGHDSGLNSPASGPMAGPSPDEQG